MIQRQKFNPKKLLWQVPLILLWLFFAGQILLFGILSSLAMQSQQPPEDFPTREELTTDGCYVTFPSTDSNQLYSLYSSEDVFDSYFVDYKRNIYLRNRNGLGTVEYGGLWIGNLLITAGGADELNWIFISFHYSPLRLGTLVLLPTFHAERIFLQNRFIGCAG